MTQSPFGAVHFTRAERTHEAILMATLECLRAAGYAGTTMEKVARLAGVSKATIYARWRSKNELIIELIDGYTHEAVQPGVTGSLYEDVYQAIKKITEVAVPIRGVIEGLVVEAERDAELAKQLRRLVNVWRDASLKLYRRAVDQRLVSGGIDENVAVDIAAAMVWFRLSIVREEDLSDLPEQLAGPLIRSWGGDPQAAG